MEESEFQELQARLQALRPALLAEKGHGFLELFDEFVREHEFELALHTACDYLRETNSPPLNKSAVDQIKRLHALMGIDDSCVEEVQSRLQQRK